MPQLARNSHSLSHHRLATFDMGYLVPVACLEVLRGDKFIHKSRALLRVQPMLKPVMHPIDVRIHHWYVPNRLLWDEWEDFITGRDPDLVFPTIEYEDGVTNYTLLDHLGVPAGGDHTLSALPVRAYNMIYNNNYRDQDIITEVTEDSLVLQRIAWQKDYFTTARAEPQFGDTGIEIPFSAGEVPVRGIGLHHDTAVDPTWAVTSGDVHESGGASSAPANTDDNRWHFGSGGTSGHELVVKQAGATDFLDITADLSLATGGISVNDLRQAMAFQRFLEHRNRYGSRHEDYLRFNGIRPSDARLQNPEYLGGGSNTISVSEVLATAEGASTDVGDLSGHGIAAISTRPYRRFFEEDGLILSLMSVRPRTMYSQQLHKMWLRRTYQDYYQKEFEALGPQAILVKELYGPHTNLVDVFGYNGRHDEYRHHPSYVTGLFRDGQSEEDWHLARDFTAAPALNAAFINCAPAERIYADTATPELYVNINHNITAIRQVSKTSRY